jgi:hypothetical protein
MHVSPVRFDVQAKPSRRHVVPYRSTRALVLATESLTQDTRARPVRLSRYPAAQSNSQLAGRGGLGFSPLRMSHLSWAGPVPHVSAHMMFLVGMRTNAMPLPDAPPAGAATQATAATAARAARRLMARIVCAAPG